MSLNLSNTNLTADELYALFKKHDISHPDFGLPDGTFGVYVQEYRDIMDLVCMCSSYREKVQGWFNESPFMILQLAELLIRKDIEIGSQPAKVIIDNFVRNLTCDFFTEEQVLQLKEAGINIETIGYASGYGVHFDNLIAIRNAVPHNKWKGIGFGGSKANNDVCMYAL